MEAAVMEAAVMEAAVMEAAVKEAAVKEAVVKEVQSVVTARVGGTVECEAAGEGAVGTGRHTASGSGMAWRPQRGHLADVGRRASGQRGWLAAEGRRGRWAAGGGAVGGWVTAETPGREALGHRGPRRTTPAHPTQTPYPPLPAHTET